MGGEKTSLASVDVSKIIDLALFSLKYYLCSLSVLGAFLTWVLHRGSAILAAQPVLDMKYFFGMKGAEHSQRKRYALKYVVINIWHIQYYRSGMMILLVQSLRKPISRKIIYSQQAVPQQELLPLLTL